MDNIEEGEIADSCLEEADSSAVGAEGSSNIKVVYPVPRDGELNPNTAPVRFRSVKDEFRFLFLGAEGLLNSGNTSLSPTAATNAAGPESEMGAVGGTLPRSGGSRLNVNDTFSQEQYNYGKFWPSKGLPYDVSLGDSGVPRHTPQWDWTANNPSRMMPQHSRLPSMPPRQSRPETEPEEVGNLQGTTYYNAAGYRARLKSLEMVKEINGQLLEQRMFQERCARQLGTLNQKFNELSTRLEVVEESRRADVNAFGSAEWRDPDEVSNHWKNLGPCANKSFFTRQWTENDYGQGDYDTSAISGSSATEGFMVGTECPIPMNNNLMLNNKVPPGSRANNFYDNFRSYTQQNMLTTPKNVPPGAISSSAANWYSHSSEPRQREVASGSITRNAGNPRHPFARTDFVENIGTKLRNQENEMQPRSVQDTRRNDTVLPSGAARSSRRRESGGTSVFEAGVEGDETARSIIDVISVFLETNGDHPDFIFSLFEKLGSIRSDADRTRVLSSLTSLFVNPPITTTNTRGISRTSFPQEGQSWLETSNQASASPYLQAQAGSLAYGHEQSALSSRQSLPSSTRRTQGVPLKSTDSERRQNVRPQSGLLGDKVTLGTTSGIGQALQRSATDSMLPPIQNLDEPILERSCWAPTIGSDDGWANSRKQSVDVTNKEKDTWFKKSVLNENVAAAEVGIETNSSPVPLTEASALDSDSNEENEDSLLDPFNDTGL